MDITRMSSIEEKKYESVGSPVCVMVKLLLAPLWKFDHESRQIS